MILLKDYYKISEVSKLYGIGVDSLRYYEKLGILKPHRDSNRYRLYRLKDMYKLNMIKDLRNLDFSMKQIKEYLQNQSVQTTLELLNQEEDLLNARLLELQSKKALIAQRVCALNKALNAETGVITVKSIPKRLCVQINEHITRDEEMDFVMKKLHRKYEGKIKDLGSQTVGAFLSMEDIQHGISNVYSSVFFVLEEDTVGHDFSLSEGEYLSYYYQGNYEKNGELVQGLLDFAQNQGFQILGTPFELYVIDNRDTAKEKEFLTEIQIRVSAPKSFKKIRYSLPSM